METSQFEDSCPDRQLLHEFNSGLLGDEKLRSLAAHIGECPRCEETVDRLACLDTVFVRVRGSASEEFINEGACQDGLADAQRMFSGLANVSQRAADDADASLPSEFSNYRILEKIGRGGIGTVYAAEHLRLRKKVAIKALSPALTKDSESISRFEREMEAAGKLDHPDIARAMDAGEVDGVHYLVMEFVDGADLATIVSREGTFSPEDACSVVRKVANALQYAHDRGLVHRDVKPSNIAIDSNGSPKLLDLGLARLSDTARPETSSSRYQTQAGSIMGTVDFMSPEQALDTNSADHLADIYSLGCTLFYLLNGHSPYPQGNALQRIISHREDEIPPLSQDRTDVPDKLETIYRRMVAKKPSERYQSMSEVAGALTPYCRDTDSAVRTEPNVFRRTAVVCGVVLGVVLTAAAAFYARSAVTGGSTEQVIDPKGHSAIPVGRSAIVFDREANRVNYTAEPGAENHVTITESNGAITLEDTGAVIAVLEGPFKVVDEHTVRINTAGIAIVRLRLGDLNDTVDASAVTAVKDGPTFEFDGGEGDDKLTGSARNDMFYDGPGSDTIDGGPQPEGSVDSWTIARDANMVLTNTTLSIGDEVDTFSQIEQVTLGGGRRDNTFDASTVTAASGIVSIHYYDYSGNDRILGSEVLDLLNKGAGTDYFDGGGGEEDTLIVKCDADMELTNTNLMIGENLGTHKNVERVELIGGESGNTLDASQVTATSGIKRVRLSGLAGDDTLLGGNVDTSFEDGSGNDALMGGSAEDNKWVRHCAADVELLDAKLMAGTEVDTYSKIKFVNLNCDDKGNMIDATAITPASGITMLFVDGGGGDDKFLISNSGIGITIDGNLGFDTLDLSGFSPKPKLRIDGPGSVDGKAGALQGVFFRNIDDVVLKKQTRQLSDR